MSLNGNSRNLLAGHGPPIHLVCGKEKHTSHLSLSHSILPSLRASNGVAACIKRTSVSTCAMYSVCTNALCSKKFYTRYIISIQSLNPQVPQGIIETTYFSKKKYRQFCGLAVSSVRKTTQGAERA